MIALIDGDILTYRFGFAANDKPFPICAKRIEDWFVDLMLFELEDADDYEGYLTPIRGNFREDYAVTAPYKGNRKGSKPVHYDEIRWTLFHDYGFKVAVEQEADDSMGIEACRRPGECIIVTIDKDLDMIPGEHYNFVKKERYWVSEQEGVYNFYLQILTGDRVDNIIGLRGIGPAKARKIISIDMTEKEMYDAVLKAYDNNHARVIENARLLWIRRRENELWTPPVAKL